MVDFPLFMTSLTNHDVLVIGVQYTFENNTKDALDSETANCMLIPVDGFLLVLEFILLFRSNPNSLQNKLR